MGTYFLGGITPEQKALLLANGITVGDMEIEGEAGIVIQEEFRERALELLGVRATREGRTPYDGVTKLLYEPAVLDLNTIEVAYSGGSNDYVNRLIAKAREILLPVVRKPIRIHRGNQEPQEPIDSGEFHIWIWSTAETASDRVATPAEMWGITVSCIETSFEPMDDGDAPIIDCPENHEVAQLVRNNLYIFHHLDCRATDDEVAIFGHILREAVVGITNSTDNDFDDDEWDEDDDYEDDDIPEPRAATPPERHQVVVGRWSGANRESFVRAIEELLLPVVGKNVTFDVPHGHPTQPEAGDRFNIFIWSSPANRRSDERAPATIWGTPVDCRDAGFTPSGRGEVFRDTETGYAVAELIDENLYVFHDLVHHGTDREVTILREILTRTVAYLTMSAEARAQMQAARERRARQVRTDGYWVNRHQANAYAAMATETLAPHLPDDKPIIVYAVERRAIQPRSDGVFHIFLWSAPSGEPVQETPETFWDIPVNRRTHAFRFSGRGLAVTDDHGYVVAELVDDNLYILHRCYSAESAYEQQIYRKILEEVVALLTLTPEQREARLREMREQTRDRSRQNYVAACVKRHAARKTTLEQEISEQTHRVDKLQIELVESIRRVKAAQRVLETLRPLVEGDSKTFNAEFDKLLTIPSVADVCIEQQRLVVFTDTLFCTDPRSGRKHEIGKFRIEFLLDKTDDQLVRWFNLTRCVERMHAPHVFEDGKPCLGNVQEIFPKLIGQYEYAAAVQIAIAFIESVNVDDSAGSKINTWPLATEPKQEEVVVS